MTGTILSASPLGVSWSIKHLFQLHRFFAFDQSGSQSHCYNIWPCNSSLPSERLFVFLTALKYDQWICRRIWFILPRQCFSCVSPVRIIRSRQEVQINCTVPCVYVCWMVTSRIVQWWRAWERNLACLIQHLQALYLYIAVSLGGHVYPVAIEWCAVTLASTQNLFQCPWTAHRKGWAPNLWCWESASSCEKVVGSNQQCPRSKSLSARGFAFWSTETAVVQFCLLFCDFLCIPPLWKASAGTYALLHPVSHIFWMGYQVWL